MSSIDRDEIQRWLPHRDPFLLVDRAEDFRAMESVTGVKDVRADDYYFAGHFPGLPIMPGVLILEALAQTGALLAGKSLDLDPASGHLMLAIVHSSRFRAPVTPGMTLKMDVRLAGSRHGLYRFAGAASVEGAKVAEAEFSAKLVGQGA